MSPEIPETVELCVAPREGLACLGLIMRREPEGRPYCYRCGGEKPGIVYARQHAEGDQQ